MKGSYKSFNLDEKTTVPYHSTPVPLLMLHKASSEAGKNTLDIRKFVEQDQSLLVTTTSSETKYVKVTRQVVLKVMRETLALISTQVAGLV